MGSREARRVNQAIRDALAEAARVEGRDPFQLSGRGHEPRVSVCRRLAGVIRGMDLPSTYISGFGPNTYYPRRVFVRAMESLEQSLGEAPVAESSEGGFYRVNIRSEGAP